MTAQGFLIRHGEKLVVALVAIVCVWGALQTNLDPATVPKRDHSQIRRHFDDISTAKEKSGRPNFQASTDFAGRMQARLARTVQAEGAVQFLTRHPDLGAAETTGDTAILLAWELGAPTVQVEDLVGKLKVTLALPESTRGDGKKLTDGLRTPSGDPWSREERIGERTQKVVNAGSVLGLVMEYQINRDKPKDEDWKAFPGLPGGFLALDQVRQQRPLFIDPVTAWEQYHFRARLVAKATGVPSDAGPRLGEEILVLDKPQEDVHTAADEEAVMKQLAFNLDHGMTVNGRARVLDADAIPAAGLAAAEKLYRGRDGEVAAVIARSNLRLALVRTSKPMNADAVPMASIMLAMLRKNAEGAFDSWVFYEHKDRKVGDPVGEVAKIDLPPHGKIPVDFSTPFEVAEIRFDQVRQRYHRIQLKTGADGQKRLEADTQTKPTEVVVLKNRKTGELMELVRLERRLTPPWGDDPCYPRIPKEGIAEEESFRGDPVSFQPPSLELPKYVQHDQVAVLADKVEVKGLLKNIVLPVFELPDGRFVFYDGENRKRYVWPAEDERKPNPPSPGPRQAPPPHKKPLPGTPSGPSVPGPGPVKPPR